MEKDNTGLIGFFQPTFEPLNRWFGGPEPPDGVENWLLEKVIGHLAVSGVIRLTPSAKPVDNLHPRA
jgi:hypothetical protein